MTQEEVVAALRERIKPSIMSWSIEVDLSPSFVSNVLSGRTPPSERLLRAAGLGHLRKVVRWEASDGGLCISEQAMNENASRTGSGRH